MIPDFDPHSYPGPRPPGPVLIHRGGLHPLVIDGPGDAPFGRKGMVTTDEAGAGTVPALADPDTLSWSVAYGSNASPGRLVAKGLDRDGAVLLPARVAGYAPAFEHRRTGYGSVPLTLVPAPGELHDTWVLGLPPSATGLLDRTEGRVPERAPRTVGPETGDGRFAPPGTYQLARIGEVAVADRFALPAALAYLPGPATRVQLTSDDRWRTWPTWKQPAAGAHVDCSGPDCPAPVVEEAVLGAWPATPLADLPLFVYGTLRPDGPAWPKIAELGRVIGPASAAGSLYDTGRGWPAASFDDHAPGADPLGRVRGVLVAATGPASAKSLFQRADAYEGVPELFVRTSIQVDGPAGRCWAASYAWAAGRPPGVRLPGGEWVVR